MTTDTPLTDAAAKYVNVHLHGKSVARRQYVPVDFARSLERTLAELREYVDHPRFCANYGAPDECVCGLDDLLSRLEGEKPHGN